MTILPKKHKAPPDPKGQVDRGGVQDHPEEPRPEDSSGVDHPGGSQDDAGQVSDLNWIDFMLG